VKTFTLGWLRLALTTLIAGLILAIPYIPLVWLLQLWLLPRLGWSALSFIETTVLVLLLRWLQPSVLLTRAPDPAPAPPVEPEPEADEQRRCDCDDCRAERGEGVATPITPRLPELARTASQRRRAEGPGVLLLAGSGDPDPLWVPFRVVDEPATDDDPRGLVRLRTVLDRARSQGTDLRSGTVIVVLGGRSDALYVVGVAAGQGREVREALTA
jgi:hypothetical protein